MRGLSLVVAGGGHSSSRCVGLSLSRPLLLRSTGSRRAGSVIVAHGPSCSAACGIFPDQGSNPRPLHWQADSQPLRHQGRAQLVWLRVKGELLGPASKGTISLTSYILLWLQFHLVAVGCEEWFHISIVVEGFALMKRIMDPFQGHFHMTRSFFSYFSSSPGLTSKPPAFQSTPAGVGIFFPPVLFSLQMACHEEEIKRKETVIVWIILCHPQKGSQGLGWIKKVMQIDWCWLEVNTSKSIP